MKTLYDRLGVTPQATHKVIQQSYFRLVKKFDLYNPDNKRNAEARLQCLALHDAYRVLSDPEARQKYDLNLRIQGQLHRGQRARPGGTAIPKG